MARRGTLSFPLSFIVVTVAAASGERSVLRALKRSASIATCGRFLSDKCFACHGPEAASRKAGFRLDQRKSAIGEAESGMTPVSPGDPDASELIARITSRRRVAADAPGRQPQDADAGGDRNAPPLDRRRRRVASPLVVRAAGEARTADGRARALAARHDRPLHPRATRTRRTDARRRGRPRHAAAARHARPDRSAADAGGGRRLPRRQSRRRLRARGRSAARLAALRRAHGPLLARRRPLRRHARPPSRQLPRDVALPRLGRPGLQPQLAVRRFHRRATRRRLAARRRATSS